MDVLQQEEVKNEERAERVEIIERDESVEVEEMVEVDESVEVEESVEEEKRGEVDERDQIAEEGAERRNDNFITLRKEDFYSMRFVRKERIKPLPTHLKAVFRNIRGWSRYYQELD